MSDYSLVLAFDTDDPEFVRGFQAAGIWERMDHESHIRATVYASNTEMVMRMCEAKGFSFVARDLDEMWIEVDLHR